MGQLQILNWSAKDRKFDLPEGLNVVGTVSTSSEVWQVELNLIPALVKSHRHGTNERFYTSRWLIVAGSETAAYVLVIKNLNLESEVLFQLFNMLEIEFLRF